MLKCKICDFENDVVNTTFSFSEKMKGTNEKFDYFKCDSCGCLQIKEYPINISDYYGNYYAFNNDTVSYATYFIYKRRNIHLVFRKSTIGKLINIFLRNNTLLFLHFFKEIKNKSQFKILDVGSGSGFIATQIYDLGFNNIKAIDPYFYNTRSSFFKRKNKIKVEKKDIYDVSDKYNLILFNHSLEHIPNQNKLFSKLSEIVEDKSYLVIRIPVSDCLAFNIYNSDWVQIDAPRHYYLHTNNSIELLAKKHNFKLLSIIQDSSDFQFWGSEKNQNFNYSYSLWDKIKFRFLVNFVNSKNIGDQRTYIFIKN